MSHQAQFDIGELIVQGVDLRMPLAPQPIFFAGLWNYRVNVDVVRAAIARYIGDGEIISEDTAVEHAPKYCVFLPRPDGRVDAAQFVQIERTFRRWGSEACVFSYDDVENKFIGRPHEWFLPARIVYS